ncbi:PRAME family member 12-like [Mus pahari]|uniref:PRAME family member 12-like n=1 Tax=Mus pahari TaxID=10093 RepID=UPI000A3129FC|nr:PRAME family member 12-like [Mus pahari]
MSTYNPPTLLQLALEGVLRKESIDFSDLEYLPITLFPPLFKEAFSGGRAEIVKAMVAAWPFPCLPVGALLKTAGVEMLQAVLDGIDILLTQNVSLRCKLQVLDLRFLHQDFWTGKQNAVCSTDILIKKQVPEGLPNYPLRQCLQVVTNLAIASSLNKHQICLLQWAQQRKDSLQLCCLKMMIYDLPTEIINEVLNTFQPTYIVDLEIHTREVLSFLGFFTHFLGQMRNLVIFYLNQIHFYFSAVNTVTDGKMCAAKFFSQFSKLNHLQHVYVNGAYISYDNMKKLFRCLKSPLESLFVLFCRLSMSDLRHMSDCQRLYQLKHLCLKGVVFSKSYFKSLRILLENVSETLETLALEHCRMKDSHLQVLLPALSQCSQLSWVNFYDNHFSSSVLKDLLRCMANLSKLVVERYPVPVDCYNDAGEVVVERFFQLCPELVDILTAKRQPKKIIFATVHCPRCLRRSVYGVNTRLCRCWR